VRKMKALTVKTETVILLGKGRYDLPCVMCSVYEINIFSSQMFYFSGVILDLGK
jgi:hypothetical protein